MNQDKEGWEIGKGDKQVFFVLFVLLPAGVIIALILIVFLQHHHVI